MARGRAGRGRADAGTEPARAGAGLHGPARSRACPSSARRRPRRARRRRRALAGRRRRPGRHVQGRVARRRAGSCPPADPEERDAARREPSTPRPCGWSPAAGRTRIVETRHGIVHGRRRRRRLQRRRRRARPAARRPRRLAPAPARRPAPSSLGVDVGRRRHRHLRPRLAGRADRRRDRRRRAARCCDHRGGTSTRTATSWRSPRSRWPTSSPRAADLVKGKLGGLPVAVVRGLRARSTTARTAPATGPRRCDEDMFRLGTEEALAQGRREAVLLRRTVRAFTDEPVDRAALPPRGRRRRHRARAAPHHARSGSSARAASAAPRCWTPWRTPGAPTCAADGGPPTRSSGGSRRGDVLRRAPELVLAVLRHRRRHAHLPRRAPAASRTHDVHGRRAARRCRTSSSRWPPRGSARLGLLDDVLPPTSCARVLDLPPDWEPLGAVAVGPAGYLQTQEWAT